jgi:hypothetical protein
MTSWGAQARRARVVSGASCGAQAAPKRFACDQASAIVRSAAPFADKSCLEATLPRLLITGRGNCLATAQLRPADDEERQLHRRTQAREIGRTQLTKLCALRIVILHEAVSLLCST